MTGGGIGVTGGGVGVTGGGTGGGATCVSPPSGIVSWWPGEGNALDIAGPNPGVASTVTYVAGRVGQAFKFNGNTSIVTAQSTGMPIGSAERSLELWVRLDQATPNQAFFAGYGSFGTNNGTYHTGALGNAGSTFFSQWGQAVFGAPLAVGTWNHVVATTRGQSTFLYINGSIAAAGVITVNTPPATNFFIGRVGAAAGSTERLNGAVDEVTVYNRALTDAEISALAAAPLGKCR